MQSDRQLEYIDVRQIPLEEWLRLVYDPPKGKLLVNMAFPSEEHKQEYLATIEQRSEKDVARLLYSFFIKSGTLGPIDQIRLDSLKNAQKHQQELYENMIQSQYYRRLVLNAAGLKQVQPWEGITWLLDLLPHFPKMALEALSAYIFAHIQELPDWRLHGLFDAAEVIRAKFIGLPGTQTDRVQFLIGLQPRYFEYLVERLYKSMQYETTLTPPQKDGGRDVIAISRRPGKSEKLLIECKRYSKPVGVKIVRALLGVVSDEKVNKGVLVTTNNFTEQAKQLALRNPRLELVGGEQFVLLMNEYLGPRWPLHIERLATESQRDNQALSGGAAIE
jgi:restriction system protein